MKIMAKVKRLVDDRLREDNKATATKLHAFLNDVGIDVLFSIVLRCHEVLGWSFCRSKYCHHVRFGNKEEKACGCTSAFERSF